MPKSFLNPGPPGLESRREERSVSRPADDAHARVDKHLSGLDVICLSHLRWNFVFQRPQHILTRRARKGRVFYFEEPVPSQNADAWLQVTDSAEGVTVAVPHIPSDIPADQVEAIQRELLDGLIADRKIQRFALWFYTPMSLGFSRHLRPAAVVYDCMDELSAFKNAPPKLREREAELFRWADVVFTGGQSLYEAKRDKHANVHAFPSSIDVRHFSSARAGLPDPQDQRPIARPRLGFCGVLDERLDRDLLRAAAEMRPDWQFVMVGPIVKIDPAELPALPNIHYLGGKNYKELPAYLGSWDAALLLFAHNESTRYISPTKTPEYLAAGLPVVSTSIRDVVRPYGQQGLVQIADTPGDFVAAVEKALSSRRDAGWLARVDAFLSTNSWDLTCERMFREIALAVSGRASASDALIAA